MANVETLPSSFRFNTKETVDVVFSRLLIANLFKDQTFRPGETFTDKYNERGGQIYVRRLGKTAATQTDATAANGLMLTHTQTSDSLVLIQKKDRISRSEMCFDLVEQLRASGQSVDKVANVLEEFKEACQMLYMGYMLQAPVAAGGVGAGGATLTADSGGTLFTTMAALIASLLKARQQIRVNGGTADTILVSPEMYALLLSAPVQFGNAFTPNYNDETLRTGLVGRLYGMKVYESNLIGSGTPLSVPVAGNALANTGNAALCQYIIYDHDTFAICGEINGIRLINAIDFFGSYAQIEGVFGGGVVNPALAYANVIATPGP